MIDNFPTCLAFTLRFEGGFADDPRDPGGRTNQGVTQRTFDAWRRRSGRPLADVRALTPSERDALYRDGYWDAVGADRLPAGVDLAVFDFAVNSGPASARKASALAAASDPAERVKQVCARRLSLLHALRTFRTFGRGWTARVAACEALGVRMAEQHRIGPLPDASSAAPQAATRLRAEAHRAALAARGRVKAAGAAAAGGIAVAPAATVAVPLPLAATLAIIALVLGVAALLAFKAWQDHRRAVAYATLAG